MFQDNYERTDPKVEAALRKILSDFYGRMTTDVESVIELCWMVDLLWQLMTEASEKRNVSMRHVWYQGVSMGSLAKRTGISKGRISKIVNK